jgi:hypothetical protein
MATKTTTTANANGARYVASEIAYLARALKAPTLACRADPALTAVGLAGGDLTLQAGRQKLFMAPVLRTGAIG